MSKELETLLVAISLAGTAFVLWRAWRDSQSSITSAGTSSSSSSPFLSGGALPTVSSTDGGFGGIF